MIATGEHTWKLHFGLAQSLRAYGQFTEAIKEIDELLRENKEQLASGTPNDYFDNYWDLILPELAGALMDAEDLVRAEETYRMVLDDSFKRREFALWAMQAVTGLSRALAKQGKHQEIIIILQYLASQPDEDVGDWLCLLLHAYADTDVVHDEIHAVARTSGSLVSSP